MLASGQAVYNNNAKADMLGVSRADLETYEAVSESVARQMAQGALTTSGAHISVAVTGYAGAWGDPSRHIDGGTALNGSSRVVDRAYILPRATMQTQLLHLDPAASPQENAPLAAAYVLAHSPASLVVSAFSDGPDNAFLSIAAKGQEPHTKPIPLNNSEKPATRQVAEAALAQLQRSLDLQQQHQQWAS